MIDVNALRKQAVNKYPGIVESRLRGENPFPLFLRFPHISTTTTREEILRDMAVLSAESKAVRGDNGISIETRSINTAQHGKNSFPEKIYFASESDYLGYIGKTNELQNILLAWNILTSAFPGLRDWAILNWKELRTGDNIYWENTCRVLEYFRTTPFPGKYIRELPIEVPTKFIEENSRLLEKLIGVVAPDSIDTTGETPAERLGLKTADTLIECRLLDDSIQPEWKFRQFTVTLRDLEHFGQTGIETVLITENRTNFLTLPMLHSTLALQGQGYAVARLKKVAFLTRCRLIYWGDLDAHGFEILATLRRYFSHTESIMMNRATVEKFPAYYTSGAIVRNTPEIFLPYLHDDEATLFQELSRNNQRLEQERLPHAFSTAMLRERIGVLKTMS
ncbi:MAG: DUF2220 family protein [Puniceicoccales bacterium]|jgi:hypothetical protein|nr:DUF2220 family protein [Puniceicoccales bacterium]